MGSTLKRALLPRDGLGCIDLGAVERALAAVAGSTLPRPAERVASVVLVERLISLGARAMSPTPESVLAKLNGHGALAPSLDSPTDLPQRETHSPASPDEPPIGKIPSPTDVRGIGRIGLASVKLEDLAELPSSRLPTPAPASDPPIVETSAEVTEVMVPEDTDRGSLPPIEVHGSVRPAALSPSTSSLPPVESPLLVSPPPAASVSPVAPSATAPPARPVLNPLGASSSTRSSYGSIAVGAQARLSPAVAAEEVAAVGAVFDEFLGSAPVEPAPRLPPPLNVPRAAPLLPSAARRASSVQEPDFRPSSAVVSPAAPRAPRPLVMDDEAIEPVEMEMEEVEEVVAPALSKGPPPLLSRPPALPPVPPKKR